MREKYNPKNNKPTRRISLAPLVIPADPKYPILKDIFVDVDGTLIIKGKLNVGLVNWCQDRKKEGFSIYLWSARGQNYAECIAELYSVDSLFTAILPKPSYIVDDMGGQWSRYINILVPKDLQQDEKNK